MLCWDGNFDQGYFRFFRIQYHLQIFKMFSYHCVHKVKQKSTSWQSQKYGFFFTLYRILDTAWPIDFVLVKYMIATLTCCHSLYLHECCCNQYYGRRKKMASYSVSIKGCSDSSMIHWFVGKRVNLFSASLIIDLRRFFVKMKDLKFLLYFLASKTEKDKQINKHWNTHSQQQGSGWFLIKTVEKFLFKREKDVDSRLVSLALEITLTQVHTVVHRVGSLATSDTSRRARKECKLSDVQQQPTRRAIIQNWES